MIALIASGCGIAYVGRGSLEAPPVANNLYVAPNGSDANPGSQFEPLRTIQRAAVLVVPGTTVYVAPGVYRENVETRVAGTAGARIRYVSDTRWGARLIGSGTEGMWTNRGIYTDIAGFDISGSGRVGILNLASHTRIEGNRVHDVTVSGGCTGRGGAGINSADYSASDDEIIGNVVHDIGVPGACNTVHGIYVANLRAKIHNNIVFRVSSWGISLWHAADHVLVANNTVFQNGAGSMGGGIMVGVGDSPGGKILSNTKVINNIVYNNPAKGIIQYCYRGERCIGSGNVIANNLVYGSATPITMMQGSATGTITADPHFVNFQANGTGDYRLKNTSPAIDQGLTASAPDTDIDNVARSRGKAPDLGAYEIR
ncbi:MAG: choice-of-anchor Q domain-containing protein [Telluria sp.]